MLPKQSTLRSDFVWTFIGNGVYAVCQWGVLVLLARVGTPELVGKYAFAVAVATPVITFATMQLRSVQVTDLEGRFQFGDYLAFRFLSLAAALVVLLLISLVLRYPLDSLALVLAVGLALAVEAVSDCFYGVMQFRNRMDLIAKSMMIRAALSTLAFGLVISFGGALILGTFAMVAVRLAVLLLYDVLFGWNQCQIQTSDAEYVNNVRLMPRVVLRNQAGIFRLTSSVGLVAMLISLNTSIPRYFIQWSDGSRMLGVFSALSVFQSTGNMITGALGQAAFKRLATSYAQSRQEFFSLIRKLLAVGFFLGAAGIVGSSVFGKAILGKIYGPVYASHSILLLFLMVAAGMGYLAQFAGYSVTAARIFAPQVPLTFGVAAVLTLSSRLLVPGRGAYGAVLALLIAMTIQLVGFLFLLVTRLRSTKFLEARYA